MLHALLLALTGTGWTRIEAPAICLERPEVRPWMPARHIERHWEQGQDDDGDTVLSKLLDFGEWSQWAESDAREAGQLEIVRIDGALLCRGSEAAVAALVAAREGLQTQADTLWIDLEARLEVGGRLVESASGRRRSRSGELVRLGSVSTTPFVAGFDIEIATDASAATPTVGAVRHGTVLTLAAVRLDGGRALRIDAWLDGALLQGIEPFDAGTSDAGVLELPKVASAQLVCSAYVASGGELVAQLKGGAFPEGAILRVKAATRADAAVAGRVLLDTAAVTRAAPVLQPLVPGFPFRGATDEEPPSQLPRAPALLNAGALGGMLSRDSGSGSFTLGSRSAKRGYEWAEHLLAVPAGDRERLDAARALVAGLAAPQASTQRLRVEAPGLSADLPLVRGRPARAAALFERSQPSAMSLEIAQQSWSAVPELLFVADGVSVEALAAQDGIESACWLAAGEAPRTVEKAQANLGRLQLAERRLASARGLLDRSGETVEAARLGTSALTLRWQAP